MKKYVTAFLLSITAASSAFATDAEVVSGTLDLQRVLGASPVIYALLLALSVVSLSIWLYTMVTLRQRDLMPDDFTLQVRQLLTERQFDTALSLCNDNSSFCARVLGCGIAARRHGPQVMMDVVQAEGRRQGNALWQRISLLNEVSVVAPMLGLLGTVLGIFIGFYDSSNSPESLSAIFDGFGIAVGTTVAGLIVAIMAMIFYTTLKFRVLNLLNVVENEAVSLVNLVEQESTD